MVGHIKRHPHPPAPLCPGSLACAGKLLLITILMATKNGADALSLKYKCTCCAHTVLLRYRVLQNDVEWKMKLLLLFWSAIEMKRLYLVKSEIIVWPDMYTCTKMGKCVLLTSPIIMNVLRRLLTSVLYGRQQGQRTSFMLPNLCLPPSGQYELEWLMFFFISSLLVIVFN